MTESKRRPLLARILSGFGRDFAKFVRELGSLILLTAAFGALYKQHPSSGLGTLSAACYIAMIFLIADFFFTEQLDNIPGTRWSWTTRGIVYAAFGLVLYAAIQFSHAANEAIDLIAISKVSDK